MSSILFEQHEAVAILTLNRPKVYNSIDREMALLFQQLLDDCAANPDIRAILITGEGKAFSAGQDLGEVTDPERFLGFERVLSEHYNPIIQRLRSIEKPIIAAINGIAAGAAANIALACDIVVASESAAFLQAFSKIGLIPDSGGTYMLPRLIGMQKASALMLLGEKVSATEAERIGMIYKVFPVESFMEEAMKIASKLSKMPTKGLGYTKRALNQALFNTLDQQLEAETQLQVQAGATDDYQEGVNAFLEKRPPHFQGK